MTDMTNSEDNSIYIGKKHVMNYVTAIVAQFNNGADEVVVKARGRAISRAVDAVEVVKNRFLKDVYEKDIIIGTEELLGKKGDMIKVSSIEIYLARKGE